MRVLNLVPVLLVLTAFLAVPAQGQASNTWFMHGLDLATATEGYLDQSPPAASEVDNAATCTGCAGPVPYVVTAKAKQGLAQARTGVAGTGTATLWLKSWNNGPAPQTEALVEILAGETVIATGSTVKDVLVGEIVEFPVELAYTGGDLAKGAILTLKVTISDATTGAYNPFAYPRGSSGEHPWQFTLPLAVAAPSATPPPSKVLYEPLKGEVLRLEKAFPTTTTQTVVHNWTSGAGSLAVSAGITRLEGTVVAVLKDGSGQALFNRTLASSGTETAKVEGKAGQWQLTLTYTGFRGNVSVAAAPPGAVSEETSAPPATSDASPTDPTGTTGPSATSGESPGGEQSTSEEPSGTPGIGLVLPLGLLALAVVVRRRL